MEDYRSIIYNSYLSYGFGDIHANEKAYRIQKRYFERNYLQRGVLAQNKSASVCDLGCGCGEFIRCLAENAYFGNLVGIDTSPENINYCKKSIDMKTKENVRFVCMTVQDYLKNTPDTYDVFIFNDIIEHLNKNEIVEILQLMKQKLRKGGCVYIKTPNMANPYVNTAGRYIDFTHEIGFTECSMKQVLKACHYCDIKIYGTDIYVFNPIVSGIAKLISWVVNLFLRLHSCLYGRARIKIFEKDILAIAYKR